jgi:hypothetical protein
LFDLFGIRYLLCWAPTGRLPLRHAGVEAMPPLADARGTFRVHERANPCPRAFVVPRAALLADEALVLAALVASDFAPRSRVLLTESALRDVGWTAADVEGWNGAGGGEVRFVLDETSAISLTIQNCGGGWLLLTDTAMDGWTARVDGEPAPIVLADLCFRAVRVPAGEVSVEFRYRPPLLWLGVAISATAAIGIAILVLGALRRARSRSCSSITLAAECDGLTPSGGEPSQQPRHGRQSACRRRSRSWRRVP